MKNEILIDTFKNMKYLLPKGSKAGRWTESRWMFKHRVEQIYPARNAIWKIMDYGEKTRDRWVVEYRHQRRLTSITLGTNFDKYEDDE